MKARIKATGNIVDVEWYGHDSIGTIYADVTHITKYYEYELDFDTVYDYWTRLEHQYAGMAMQALIIDASYAGNEGSKYLVEECTTIAHALVGKMKEERK